MKSEKVGEKVLSFNQMPLMVIVGLEKFVLFAPGHSSRKISSEREPKCVTEVQMPCHALAERLEIAHRMWQGCVLCSCTTRHSQELSALTKRAAGPLSRQGWSAKAPLTRLLELSSAVGWLFGLICRRQSERLLTVLLLRKNSTTILHNGG